jgi:hypothetical protein
MTSGLARVGAVPGTWFVGKKERTMPYVSHLERLAEEKGRAMGRIEGREEGQAEGEIKGRVEAKVEDLLELLALRFQTAIPAKLEERIRATTDRAQLDAWFRTGVGASDLADFRRLGGI